MDGKYKSLKIIKCPKCKTKYPNLIDYYEGHIVKFHGNEDGSYEEGVLCSGDVVKVIGECRSCDYFWTIRKKSMAEIIDI